MLFSDLQAYGSQVRHPQLLVTMNGTVLTGVIDAEVVSTSNFHGDTFRITAAVSNLPAAYGPAYFANSVGDEVEIKASVDNGLFARLIYGQVDDVCYSPVHRTLTLSGRDLSALFIDKKVTITHYDQKASDIVAKIVAGHPNMVADITPTKRRIGSHNQINSRCLMSQSEWDLLVMLAQEESYDLWVNGNTLHFKPMALSTDDPYIVKWQDLGQGQRTSNVIDVEMSRSQTLARDLIVEVYSWNQEQGKKFTATVKRVKSGNTRGASSQTVQTYRFQPPNLTQEQVNAYANAKADEISKHEKTITVTLPGDNLLTARTPLRLNGTGTSWDQIYYPDTVTRRLSFHNGYTMEVKAKNHGAVISS